MNLPLLKIVLAEPAKPETVPFKDVPVGGRFCDPVAGSRFARKKVLYGGDPFSVLEGEGFGACRWGIDEAFSCKTPCILLPDDPADDGKAAEREEVPFGELAFGTVFQCPTDDNTIYMKTDRANAAYARNGAAYWEDPLSKSWEDMVIPLGILTPLDASVFEGGEG